MRIHEIETIKPLTPEEQRIKALQATAERAKSAVKQERTRQRIAKAQMSLQKAKQLNR
jgi:hypothetical protein